MNQKITLTLFGFREIIDHQINTPTKQQHIKTIQLISGDDSIQKVNMHFNNFTNLYLERIEIQASNIKNLSHLSLKNSTFTSQNPVNVDELTTDFLSSFSKISILKKCNYIKSDIPKIERRTPNFDVQSVLNISCIEMFSKVSIYQNNDMTSLILSGHDCDFVFDLLEGITVDIYSSPIDQQKIFIDGVSDDIKCNFIIHLNNNPDFTIMDSFKLKSYSKEYFIYLQNDYIDDISFNLYLYQNTKSNSFLNITGNISLNIYDIKTLKRFSSLTEIKELHIYNNNDIDIQLNKDGFIFSNIPISYTYQKMIYIYSINRSNDNQVSIRLFNNNSGFQNLCNCLVFNMVKNDFVDINLNGTWENEYNNILFNHGNNIVRINYKNGNGRRIGFSFSPEYNVYYLPYQSKNMNSLCIYFDKYSPNICNGFDADSMIFGDFFNDEINDNNKDNLEIYIDNSNINKYPELNYLGNAISNISFIGLSNQFIRFMKFGSIRNVSLFNITLITPSQEEKDSEALLLNDDHMTLDCLCLKNSSLSRSSPFNFKVFNLTSDFKSIKSLGDYTGFEYVFIKDHDIKRIEFADEDLFFVDSNSTNHTLKFPSKSILIHPSTYVTLSIKDWKTRIHKNITIEIESENNNSNRVYFDNSFSYLENSDDLNIKSSSDLLLVTDLGSFPNISLDVDEEKNVTKIWSHSPTPSPSPSMSATPLASGLMSVLKSVEVIESVTFLHSETQSFIVSRSETLIDSSKSYVYRATYIPITMYLPSITNYYIRYYNIQKIVVEENKISELAIIGITCGSVIVLIFLVTIGITIRRHFVLIDLYESSSDENKRKKRKRNFIDGNEYVEDDYPNSSFKTRSIKNANGIFDDNDLKGEGTRRYYGQEEDLNI